MQFDVKVCRGPGEMHVMPVVCSDATAARAYAEHQGYAVLSVRPSSSGFLQLRRSVTFDVALFAQELLALLEAGMGLVEALALLSNRARQTAVREVLSRVVRSVGEGQPFSKALGSVDDQFPVLFVASVRASERTGDLVEGLKRYLSYHQQVNALRSKVVSASIYPCLLLAVGMLVILFLVTYVVPRFSSVYAGMNEDQLPVLSKWLMWSGQLAADNALLLVSLACVLAGGAVALLRRQAFRVAVERWLWRLPQVGEQIQIYQLARFTRTVAMLLKAGIPLVSALDMTEALLRQPALKSGLKAACRALREGRSLSETFREHGLASEVGARLLVVGERSGELGETMDKIAAFYEEETSRHVEWFTRLFEPTLMVIMGLLIGGIVILMYMPIFQLASSIQ